jgi:OOP family OmpA-OmpF porin
LAVVTCDLGPIATDDEAAITVIVISPPPPDALTLSVTVGGENFDPDSSNNNLTVTSNVVAAVTVRSKAKGGGAFGVIEMLLLIMAAALLRIRRVRRANLGVLLSTGVLCGLMLGSPNISQAQDSTWYVGLGYGSSEADSDISNFGNDMLALGHVVSNLTVDDSSEGLKLFGGYNFNEYFAAELAYVDLGEVTVSFDGISNDVPQMLLDAGGLLPVLGDGFSVAAVGRYPFGERFAIFGKVGAYFWEADLAIDVTGGITATGNPTVDGTDVVYGVGGDLYLGDLFGLRLEWERYALDPNDVDFVSASVLFRF